MRYLFLLTIVLFYAHAMSWIPEDYSESATALTEEQKNVLDARSEEQDVQAQESRKKLFEKYDQTLLRKNDIYFLLMPCDILKLVLEYRFPLQVKQADVPRSEHRSYGVPGVCCCSRCN